MLTTQYLATQILLQVLEKGRNLNVVFAEYFKKNTHLTAQQRGAIQDICYGSLRYFGELNQIVLRLSQKELAPSVLRYLLVSALYQLRYTNETEYTVVNCAVQTVVEKLKLPQTKGFINAILRQYLRIKEEFQEVKPEENYPTWWVKRVKKEYPETWAQYLTLGLGHPSFTLRVNEARISRAEYVALLIQSGFQEEDIVLLDKSAILLRKPVAVAKLPKFDAGFVSIQDAGAQFSGHLLPIHTNDLVLDACAAPGGKTTHLLEKCANLRLVAMDSDKERLKQVQSNLDRLELEANIICGDASDARLVQSILAEYHATGFNAILADVPCSASGVIRRHADIKWLRQERDIKQFSHQQKLILENLWQYLLPNGYLLYVTCSIFAEENQLQIEQFLQRHCNARLVPVEYVGFDDSHDGFYYALLQKMPD